MRAVPSLLTASLGFVLAACQPAQPPVAGGNDTSPPTPQPEASTGSATAFQCGDLSVRATFNGEDAATVVIGDRTFAMTSERVASGAKYADGKGNSFWTKGSDDGLLSLKGEADRECHAVDATEGDGSAGTAAFRASGNEPGWLAVVDGDAPGLQVEVDYGERRFDVAKPTEGADGWSGKASDGTDVKLSFQRTTCQDDMSGEAFEAKAMLTVGTRQYHGCGNFGAKQP
ncbi:MliC family protein [uncultured Stenotrophomonas sp.]|uniref:MliC family protein n=1 Tax=uncultured Stenotrophomonas sp. TaxID=165438 RepID=UPI0025D5EDAA|nr:MliC family protein [uncultured Stenotrophomonas sp.]